MRLPVPWTFARELARWGPTTSRVPSPMLARSYCAYVARSHYENFTVASVLLPRRLLPDFYAVYAYCRWADDLADETAGGQTSLDLLAWWRQQLLAAYDGMPTHPVLIALQATIRRFAIPREPFLNLLAAFEQDQRQKSYATFDDLLGYCRNSANPVGWLVLYLFECHDAIRGALSDEVCTGLQLANFWQDVSRDLAIGRVYLPIEDRLRFGYSDEDLHARRFTPAFAELMKFEVARTRDYFTRGKALLPLIPKRLRIDIDLFIRGGEAILAAIGQQQFDVWTRRPEVSKAAKIQLLGRAVTRMMRSGHSG